MKIVTRIKISLSLVLIACCFCSAAPQAKEADDQPLPSHFDSDAGGKFSESKWLQLTDQGIKSLNTRKFASAEQYFQAAVREATKAPCMSTYMVDSLVHIAEVCRRTNRKQEAKDNYDQALAMVKMLVADKCPMCESSSESIPVIYGPHSDDLEAWVKSKAVQLGDFKSVTNKRKARPAWYCKMCENAY